MKKVVSFERGTGKFYAILKKKIIPISVKELRMDEKCGYTQ